MSKLHFRRMREEDLEQILKWRTKPEITRYMYTDIEYNMDKQKQWFKAVVKGEPVERYWVICYGDRSIGLLNLENMLPEKHQTGWAYYMGDPEFQTLGGLISPYFFNYLFFKRDPTLQKVVVEVFADNINALKMNLHHGFRDVTVLKNHIVKNGTSHDVAIQELTRESWINKQKTFGHYIADFED